MYNEKYAANDGKWAVTLLTVLHIPACHGSFRVFSANRPAQVEACVGHIPIRGPRCDNPRPLGQLKCLAVAGERDGSGVILAGRDEDGGAGVVLAGELEGGGEGGGVGGG